MSPPLKGGRGDSSIFPRLHRTIPEPFPSQSRVNPDTRSFGRWGPRRNLLRWGEAEASVARRLSVAVSTIATRLPNALDNP